MSVYLDNSATTKIRPEALDEYIRISNELYGNPSSLHEMGFLAERELESSRKAILKTLGMTRGEVIFTASGTEANNLAVFGRAFSKERFACGGKIITTMGEHASVEIAVKNLEKRGFRAAFIPTRGGELDLEALAQELDSSVILASFMMVNNETGAIYNIKAASELIRQTCRDALIHVDATQSYLKLKFTKRTLDADMITVSSHKIEGPKGVGALVCDQDIIKKGALCPIIVGGGQENGMRSGTQNVPGIAAFAKAASLGFQELDERISAMQAIKAYLLSALKEDGVFSDIIITEPKNAAHHILNITVPNIKSETLLHFLSSNGVYVSSGSACSSNSNHNSSALTAFGHTSEQADSSIRISLSHHNTKDDIDALLLGLKKALSTLARKSIDRR